MTRRRSGATRRWAIIASGLVALVLAGLAIADAAQLSVGNRGIFLTNLSRCTNGPIATTAGSAHHGVNIDSVNLAGVAAACAGLPVSVVVYRSNGTSLATGTGTASAGSFDIATTPSYKTSQVAGVALLIGTWSVPTTWSAAPVVLPAVSCIALTPWTGGWPPPNTYGTPTGGTCTATISNYAAWGSPLSNFNFTVTVSGAANWELTFNFANTTVFPGFTPTNVGSALNPYEAPGNLCSDLPVLVVRKYLPYNSDTGYVEANNIGQGTSNQMCP